RVRLRRRPRGLPERAEVDPGVDALEPLSQSLGVLDVDDEAVLAVPDEVDRLADARRHERHTARHRLERRLRPALLAGGDETRVERAVNPGQLPRQRVDVEVRDLEPLETGPHEAARGAGQEDEELRDARSR